MKCREALKHLYEYLDQQLDNRTVDKIREHLEKCKHCFEKYEFEKNLNNFLKKKSTVVHDDNNVGFDEAVGKLKDTIRNRIRTMELSQNQETEQREDGSGFFLFRRPVLGVTAFAVVAVVALFLFLKTSNSSIQAGIFTPLIENHQNAINGSIAMDIATDDPFLIDTCLSAKMKLPKSIFLVDSLYSPTMAQVGYSEYAQFAQIVYNVSGNKVSVFCIKKSDYDFPEKALAKLEDMPNTYTINYNSQELLLWQCPLYWYVAVSSLDYEIIKDFISHLN